jgi:hypothetical protein
MGRGSMNDRQNQKNSTSFKFTLFGEPVVVHSNKQHVAKYWYDHKQTTMDRGFQLEEQIKGHRKLYGNLDLIVECFFSKPVLKGKKFDLYSSYIISDLVRFIERICTGIIYDKSAIVTSLNIFKQYDPNPRTIITIIETK